jgi:hypothetical protein
MLRAACAGKHPPGQLKLFADLRQGQVCGVGIFKHITDGIDEGAGLFFMRPIDALEHTGSSRQRKRLSRQDQCSMADWILSNY